MNKAYLFEAHSIQSYILEGGKLSEMVGASEILEELVSKGGPLDMVLAEMGLVEKDDFVFAQRGGGAFYLLFDDAGHARRYDYKLLRNLRKALAHAKQADTEKTRRILSYNQTLKAELGRLFEALLPND
jgi:hypothetical protein